MSIQNVIQENMCIGCGNCVVANSDIFHIDFDIYGMYKGNINNNYLNLSNKYSSVCPFADNSLNEDQISSIYFNNSSNYDNNIGNYESLYAGYVKESNYRSIATSGGIITWILCELKKLKKIDYVIHVKESVNNKDNNVLFKYAISETVDEILVGAKSRYYPVEISKVMEIVKNNPGNYAFVGLPCFIKAVRLLMNENEIFQQRIKYCIGLVCGHLKSAQFANLFAWQVGIPPNKLEKIDFRVKLDNHHAGDYGVSLNGDGKEVIKRTQDFFGFNWRNNFFRNPACNYCDDVFAETADMVVGDAWLPEYISESKGNSVVALRNKELNQIIKKAINENRLSLDNLSEKKFIESQAGGIRDRREGLSYRLFLKKEAGEWTPKKRVKASNELSNKRKQIYELRMKMEKLSHNIWQDAIKNNSYQLFEDKMKSYVAEAEAYYKTSLVKRIFLLVFKTIINPNQMFRKLIKKLKGIK